MNQQSIITNNLCIKHFPEPIIYLSDSPLCKKCVIEYLEKKKKEKGDKSQGSDESMAQMVKMFGLPQNRLYSNEKQLIDTYLLNLDDFKGDFRNLEQDIKFKAEESEQNL